MWYTHAMEIPAFRRMIYGYFKKHGRDLPWRHYVTPYRVLVSEVMLQQTQVDRVIPAFERFIKTFPTIRSLADASLRDVLAAWQGLGYNRRARFLHETAQRIAKEYRGRVPTDPMVLETFPGIGKNTAASICAFAFDAPVVFVETNIRSVHIKYFFPGKASVRDEDILNIAAHTMDQKHPRQWYSALMDFGSNLKKREPNPSRKSAHYVRQKPFKGSVRETRGAVMRALLAHPRGMTAKALSGQKHVSAVHFKDVLVALNAEGVICNKKTSAGKKFFIA